MPDVVILNYANGDMVGHTGNYDAAVLAVEFLDKCLKRLYDKVMESFPMLEKFMHDTQEKAREHGYVETPWGRRRHLKDMQLEPYIFKYDGKESGMEGCG